MRASAILNISTKKTFWKFLPFWIFLVFFKFGAGLHFTILSPLGEKLFPLWLVGLLISAGSLTQLLLDVPAGHILDRYGYRKFLKITTATFLIATICFWFGLSKTTYLASIFFSTFGWLFFGPGINAYILSHAPKIGAGKFISFRDIFSSIGIVCASAALPFVLFYDPKHIGYILFFLLLIALIMLFFSPKDHTSVLVEMKLTTQHHYIRRHYILTLLKTIKKLNPASTMLLLLNLSSSIFYGIIWFVVPLVIVHEVNTGMLSIGLGIFDLSVVVLGFFLGNMADTSNKRTMIFFGLLLFGIAGMFLGFNFGWLFILFGFLSTSGNEMAGISLWSWLHTLDKKHAHDGAIAGVLSLFDDLGWAIGPLVAGCMYSIIGPSWTILIGTIPIFITWIVYQNMTHHKPKLALAIIPQKPHQSRHKR